MRMTKARKNTPSKLTADAAQKSPKAGSLKASTASLVCALSCTEIKPTNKAASRAAAHWMAMKEAIERHPKRPRRRSARVTAGLYWAPEIGPPR